MSRRYALMLAALLACSPFLLAPRKPTPPPVVGPPAPPVEYAPGTQIAEVADAAITESSGLGVARWIKGAFWTHNDSGDTATLYAVDAQGRTVATLTLNGVKAIDWEDMASYVHHGTSTLLVGDVGDNTRTRKTCTLYVIREPAVYPGKMGVKLSSGAETIEFTYADGPQDCEGVAIDTTTRRIYLVSKDPAGMATKVYELPWPPLDKKGRRTDKGPYTARQIATLPIAMATAMDMSPDGLRCVILTYGNARQYVRGENEPWADAFKRKGTIITLPKRKQGESICYGIDGKTLYLTSERRGDKTTPLLSVPTKAPAPKLTTLTIYGTGDIHEHTANLARVAALARAAKKVDPNTLFLDAGDMCGGNGEAIMAATNGDAMWALLTEAGYDACVLGNHDYNKGMARIEELCHKYPKFPLLLANANWSEAHKKRGLPEMMPPYKIVKLQGLTVAIVGVGSHDMRYSRPERFPIYFAPTAVKRLVPVLRKKSDIVIAITHQYEADDYWKTATGEHENTPDIIIGGHSHGAYTMPYGYRYKRSFIGKAGPYIKATAVIQFTWDGQKVIQRIGHLQYMNREWPEDPGVKALRDKYLEAGAKAEPAKP